MRERESNIYYVLVYTHTSMYNMFWYVILVFCTHDNCFVLFCLLCICPAGMPPFPGEEEDGTREPSPTYKGRLSALSSRGRLSAKSTVKPKTISFDDYHALWKGIATSQPLRPKRNPS